MKKLNLGCGNDIKKGYVNLDVAKLPGIDVVHDLNKFPYPFKDNEFDEIYCKDILEHLNDYIHALKEIHRILKKGGRVIISLPHFTSVDNFRDPTHKNMFSASTFDFFVKSHERNYYTDFHFSKAKSKISFRKGLVFFLGYLLEPIVNLSKKFKGFYEATGFCYIFPAWNIHVELVK